jgi:hypothetical protein
MRRSSRSAVRYARDLRRRSERGSPGRAGLWAEKTRPNDLSVDFVTADSARNHGFTGRAFYEADWETAASAWAISCT